MLNLAPTLNPLGQMLRRGESVDIAVIGDSLSFRDGTYFNPLKRHLQQEFGDAGAGYQPFSVYTGAQIPHWWTSGAINEDAYPNWGLEGLYSESIWGGTAQIGFKSETIELHYLTRQNGGAFRPRIQRGPTDLPMDWVSADAPADGVGVFRYDVQPGDSGLAIEADPNQRLALFGVNHINPGAPGVRMHRIANGGFGVENYLSRQISFNQQLKALEPELVMVWLGQNDQNYSRELYREHMGYLVDRIRISAPEASILLLGTYNQGAPALAGLVEGVADLADERGLGFLNLYDLGGTPEWLASQGYLDDGIHFSPAGGEYFSDLLSRYLDPAFGGIGYVPEPGGLCAILALVGAMSRRRGKTTDGSDRDRA